MKKPKIIFVFSILAVMLLSKCNLYNIQTHSEMHGKKWSDIHSDYVNIVNDSILDLKNGANLYEYQGDLKSKLLEAFGTTQIDVREIVVKKKQTWVFWLTSLKGDWVIFDAISFSDDVRW